MTGVSKGSQQRGSVNDDGESFSCRFPACQGRVFFVSNKGKGVAKQTIFTRATFIAEQVTGNFRHFETTGNIDIVIYQRAMILQYRR